MNGGSFQRRASSRWLHLNQTQYNTATWSELEINTNKWELSKVRHGRHTKRWTIVRYNRVKRWAESSKASLNHILINLFIVPGHVSSLSQSITQRSHVCFDQKLRKERPVCDHKNRHTFKDARHDGEDTTTAGWSVEANLIRQLPIRSPKCTTLNLFMFHLWFKCTWRLRGGGLEYT